MMVYPVETAWVFMRDLGRRITEMLESEADRLYKPGMKVSYSIKGRVFSGVLCPGRSPESAIDHTVVTLEDYACYLRVKSDKTGKTYPVRHQNIRIEGENNHD